MPIKGNISPWEMDCPTYNLFGILGKKRVLHILLMIDYGHTGFSEIMKKLSHLHAKVLSERLTDLINYDIITKEQYKDGPKYGYFLTSKGKKVMQHIKLLDE